MKRAVMLSAFLGCLAFAGAGYAQDKPDPDKKAEGDKPEQEAKPARPSRTALGDRRVAGEMGRILRDKDGDRDNKLSPDEFGDADAFKSIDKNEDGFLTIEELVAGAKAVSASVEKQALGVMEEEFRILDRDDDGRLTKAELGDDFVGLLVNGDKNDDKKLDLVEWQGARAAASEPRNDRAGDDGGSIMARIDKDGDGKISKEEAPDRLKENFDKLDKNSDGFLTEDEVNSARAVRRDRKPPEAPPEPPKDEKQPTDKDKPDDDTSREMEDEF
ncbi:MAG: hypothetical protein K8I27_08570 [Planctomycetes bacterium]|nr:hypothetical protein [Planctomycetota bacterium]